MRLLHGRVAVSGLGLKVGAARHPLEIRVWRKTFGKPFRAALVDAQSGARLHRFPNRLLVTSPVRGFGPGPELGPGFGGGPFPRLAHFIKVTFHRPGGAIAGTATIPFCPSGFRERMNGSGPELSRYPYTCSSGSLFARGLVWGIDRGWASAPMDFGGPDRQLKLKRGRYHVVAKITRRYRHIFDVSSKAASARLDVVVRGGGGGGGGQPEPLAEKADDKEPPAPAPTVGDPPLRQRPDLAALPAWNVVTDSPGHRDLLTFAATEWNAGPGSLDIEGFRREGHTRMRAYQYFHDRRGHITGRARAGSLEYDSRNGHHHWHLLQFARYTLLDGSKHRVVTSHKQSFCIAPTDLVDLTVPGADWLVDTSGLFSSCGDRSSLWVREILAAGWGDTYAQTVSGQAFGINHVPNGRYFIKIEVNPERNLFEAKHSNDAALRRIRLGGTPGHRTVHVSPWHGIANG
jgi:hypothetical protein